MAVNALGKFHQWNFCPINHSDTSGVWRQSKNIELVIKRGVQFPRIYRLENLSYLFYFGIWVIIFSIREAKQIKEALLGLITGSIIP